MAMTYVNKGSVLAVGILFIILGILAVGARFYVRRKKAGYGIDDWLCLPALVLVIGECCIFIVGSATNSIGSHNDPNLGLGAITYKGADQVTLEELEFPFDLMAVVALALLKLVILFFYRRIFRGRGFNIASWILTGIVVAWAVAFFIAKLAACGNSIRTNFDTLGKLKEKCVNTFTLLVCLTVFDVVVDLAIMILPIPLIWSLQMATKRKIAVTFTFLVGALAIACGITRMVYFAKLLGPKLFSQPTVFGILTTDNIGIVSMLMFWGMLEIGVAMVAVCLPTLMPLFHGWTVEKFFQTLRTFFSLESLSLRRSARSSSSKRHQKMDSETSLAKEDFGYTKQSNSHQAYAMGPVDSQHTDAEKVPGGSVWVNSKLTQTVETV